VSQDTSGPYPNCLTVNYADHFSLCCVLLRNQLSCHATTSAACRQCVTVTDVSLTNQFADQSVDKSSRLRDFSLMGYLLVVMKPQKSRRRCCYISQATVSTTPKLTLLNSLKWQYSFSNRMMWTVVQGTYLTIREIIVIFNDFNGLKHSAFLYCWI